MKKLILSLMILGLAINVFAADQWDKNEPLGTRDAADIDSYIQTNNAALDRLAYLTRVNSAVIANTSSTLNVLPGALAIPNSDGSVVRWRRNTSSTSVTWSDLDTGSEAASTQYYVYAEGDTDETGFGFVISTSSSSPSGYIYYRKIGYFYNDSSSNIVNVGNIKDGDCPNIMKVTGTDDITTTSSTYVDMTDMEIRFVSNGRPVKITFVAPLVSPANGTDIAIDVDGTDKIVTQIAHSGYTTTAHLAWLEDLSSGAHTIKVQWKCVSGGTSTQSGSTKGARILIVEEQ